MKLNNLKSSVLLPDLTTNQGEIPLFDKLNWLCNAFDIFIKSVDNRRLAMAAPYSLEAIRKLTDEEMQEYYQEFGLASYYPDISRTARENFLYEQYRYFRKLGTQAAIEALCQYIFGDNPISFTVIDNLAFDENGILKSKSLLNLYDAIITVERPQLDEFEMSRLFVNLTKFNRDSQKLRGMVTRFEADMGIYSGASSLDYARFYDNAWIPCTLSQIQYRIGIDTYVPAGTSTLKSKYYWFWRFSGGSSYSNLWTPQYYADSLNPSNPDSEYSAVPNGYYQNVWLYDGSNVTSLSGSGITFKLAVYPYPDGVPEFYTSSQAQADQFNSACVIELAEGSLVFYQNEFSLPSDSYSISGTTVTWDTSHPVIKCLYGKDFIYY